jgi:hypothetical protein
MLHAQTYTIHLSHSEPPAKIEALVTPASAEWEVTATYDSALCEIHCSWRRKRNELGRMPLISLLPPNVAIRIYTDFASLPAVVIVDPAGLRLPQAASSLSPSYEAAFMPARKLLVATFARRQHTAHPAPLRSHFFSPATQAEVTPGAPAPLRI